MAEQLLKNKDLRSVSKQLKSTVHTEAGRKLLNSVLDVLLDPQTSVDDWIIDYICNLIAGDISFEEFSDILKKSDNSVACGLVWTADFVAYRCRTCGISPCMSICADCFHGGNHEGHDFNMFRSLAGGACDCGDASVMKSSGFCSRHSSTRRQSMAEVPKDLTIMADLILPRVILRLLLHFRLSYKPEPLQRIGVSITPLIKPLMDLLDDLTKKGAVMRNVMVKTLTDEHLYLELTQASGPIPADVYRLSLSAYKAACAYLAPPDFKEVITEDLPSYPSLEPQLHHTNFVGELLFWTAVYDFPQEMITFLLSMLTDNSYKELFTRIFVQHYTRIAMTLTRKTNPSHVVHVSVQLFSNEVLALKMVKEMGLLHALCLSGCGLLQRALQRNPLLTVDENGVDRSGSHLVVNCDSNVLMKQSFWPIVSDFSNVMSHHSVAEEFFKDQKLMNYWSKFLRMFMGMNVNKRELFHHVEYEPNALSTAFAAEIEGCAAPMWQIVSHCKDKTRIAYTLAIVKELTTSLIVWLKELRMVEKINPLQVTFHLPLLRYLSIFVSQGVIHQGLDLEVLFPNTRRVKQLMMFPLQIMVTLSEVFCNVWVRNGVQMRCQAMTYLQCHFCASMADLDLFFLQGCAAVLDKDELFTKHFFIQTILERFRVTDWLTFNLNKVIHSLDSSKQMALIEGALTFLATLVSIRIHLGMPPEEILRQEMVSLLCMENRTFSKLQDKIPEKTGIINTSAKFDEILKEVADFQMLQSDLVGLQQGRYSPKASVWEQEFDPLHTMFRSMEKKEFQNAMDRYTTFCKKSERFHGSGTPWPPFQPLKPVHLQFENLRNVLNSKTLHAALLNILYKSVNTQVVSEKVMYLTVALLDMCLQCLKAEGTAQESVTELATDGSLDSFYQEDDFLVNLRTTVKSVSYVQESVQKKVFTFRKSEDLSSSNLVTVSLLIQSGGLMEVTTTQAEQEDDWVHILNDGGAEVGIPDIQEAEMDTDDDGTPVDGVPELMAASAPFSLLPSEDSQLQQGQNKSKMSASVKRFKTDQQTPSTSVLDLKESILSLLIKLHEKLSEKEGSYLPPSLCSRTGMENEEVLGGQGPQYIARFLDRVIKKDKGCEKAVETICQKYVQAEKHLSPEKTLSSLDVEKAERRKRANEAKNKLFAQLASQQQQFLKVSLMMGEDGTDMFDSSSTDSDGSPLKHPRPAPTEEVYECAICGHVGPSVDTNPYGLSVLMQPTMVIGHRSLYKDAKRLSLSDEEATKKVVGRCRQQEAARFDMAVSRHGLVPSVKALGHQSSIAVHIQTCGHHIHIQCLKSFTGSLGIHDPQARHLDIRSGEFECPMCRQLANSILPCPLPKPPTLLSHQSKDDMHKMIKEISERLGSCSRRTSVEHSLAKSTYDSAVFKFVDDIYLQLPLNTRKEIRTISNADLIYLSSLARMNLDLELIRRGGSLLVDTTSPTKTTLKRSCLVSLLANFGHYLEGASKPSLRETWELLTGVQTSTPSLPEMRRGSLPLLQHDVSSLMFMLLFHLPQPVTKDHLQCLVQVLFNLLAVKALAYISCFFPRSERQAWQWEQGRVPTEMTSQNPELADILGFVIQQLSHQEWLYKSLHQEDFSPIEIEFCHSIWSPMKVEDHVKQYCLPFLRIAALLQYHLFQQELPACQVVDQEFQSLAKYLKLGPEMAVDGASVAATQFVQYSLSSCFSVIKTWCHEFNAYMVVQFGSEKNVKVPRALLTYNPVYHQPELIQLPTEYTKLFEYYRHQTCARCHKKPSKPIICLVCGELLCWGSECCVQTVSLRRYGEGIWHAKECGAGTGLYLFVNQSTVLIVSGKRYCSWASLYLDRHGEEDRGLRRGKPLFLCQQRFTILEHLWRTLTLQHYCKGWEWNKNGLD